MKTIPLLVSLCSFLAIGCGHDDDGHGDENEVITTVSLSFTPAGGGAAIVAVFDDADGDGGAPPTIDTIDLLAGAYTATLVFENGLESPPEDITEEIADESQEHQIFFTGSAVDGPASDNPGAPLAHSYADQDVNGLPIGLANTFTATAGTGELTVTLRHLPPIGDTAVKTEGLADDVRGGGFAAIGGSSDSQVNFPVTVQ